MSEDDFDVAKFLKDIEEAIPKYQKTLERLQGFLEQTKDPTLRAKIQYEKRKIEETINNLELTKTVYSSEKTKPSFTLVESDALERKIKSENAIKESDKVEEETNQLGQKVEEGFAWTKKFLSKNQAFAAGALILTAGLAIGITLLTQGTSTHTQLDIFLLSNNVTEFDQNKYQNYENLRIDASFKQIVGTAVLIGGYLLGVYIMIRKNVKEKTEKN